MSVVNEGFVEDRGEGDDKGCQAYFYNTCKGNGLEETEGLELHKTMETPKREKEADYLFEESRNFIAVGLSKFWSGYDNFLSKHGMFLKRLFVLIAIVAVIIYIGAVIHQFHIQDQPIQWCQSYGLAFIVFCLIMWTLVYYLIITPYLLPIIIDYCNNKTYIALWRKFRLLIGVIIVLLLAVFIVWDTWNEKRRLISLGGLFTFIACGFIFSKHPTRVMLRTVFMGILLQFLMGVFAIRWNVGRQIFTCIGELAEEFLQYAYIGAKFVFGDLLVVKEAVFAFQALSAIFFVSMIVQVLFYLGWMQIICLKLGWFMQVVLGTTVMESVNAVSSVFLGMTEAPLLYKPYIKDLTPSEMHAVMAGGFSTVAGSVFAAYASFGVNPSHIITASMMTAPAALCFAKLVYPENTQSKTDSKNVVIYKSEDNSVMDAVIQGALVGVNMVQGIIATVIACVSIVAFFNDLLAWLGLLAGIHDFTLETIFSYLFYPAVWLMGVEPSQCLLVARLIGIKVTVNEFVAYVRLGEIAKTGVLSPRTEAIATYAMCSFANPGSVGILISSLTTLCPAQRFNILDVATRAFLSAIIISFLTACIAGALMPEEGF